MLLKPMPNLLATITSLVLLFSASVSFANEQQQERAKAQQSLRQLLTRYDGFTADFSQTVTDSEGILIHSGNGKLAFEQPGKFLWELVEPEPELLISDGITLWWYNPFLEQVSIFDAENAVQTTPFALLVSLQEQTWQQFSITKQNNDYIIEPKDDNARVVRLTLRFKHNELQQILVKDRTEQTSDYVLTAQKFNNTSDLSFSFTLPVGIEVDDQRATPVVTDGNVQY